MKLNLSLLLGAAALALITLLGSADTVHAQTFNPEIDACLDDATTVDPNPFEKGDAEECDGDNAPEALTDITAFFDVPAGDVQFQYVVTFVPPEWEISPGKDIPIGAVVGDLVALSTLGLVGAQCDNSLIVKFTMLNASLDTTDTIHFDDVDDNGTEDVFEDKDLSGLQDGMEKYPDWISRIIGDAKPIRRAAGVQIVADTDVFLQFLVFEPGTFLLEEVPTDESLGYPMMVFLQDLGDPERSPEPNPLTDYCTPLISASMSYGVSRDNPCTDVRDDGKDNDNDGMEDGSGPQPGKGDCSDGKDNDGDTLIDAEDPYCQAFIGEDPIEQGDDEPYDDDGDTVVNEDGGNKVEAVCAVTSAPLDLPEAGKGTSEPDESGIELVKSPAEAGTYDFTVYSLGRRDADGDGYENEFDSCPYKANVGDPRIKGEGDGDEDGLDAACDPNDDPETGGLNTDEDGDGYANRGDNCPLIANGEELTNQRDDDTNEQGAPRPDGIGNDCDEHPDTPDGESIMKTSDVSITIGGGGEDGDGDDGGGGGGTAIIIIAVVVAAVVVVGGGAFFLMRRKRA